MVITAQKRNDNSTRFASTTSTPQNTKPVMQWVCVDNRLVYKWVIPQY